MKRAYDGDAFVTLDNTVQKADLGLFYPRSVRQGIHAKTCAARQRKVSRIFSSNTFRDIKGLTKQAISECSSLTFIEQRMRVDYGTDGHVY
jgi:hypothetical protein